MTSPVTQSNSNPWMPVLNKAQWPTSNVTPSVKGTQEVEWSTSWTVPTNTTSVPKQQTKVITPPSKTEPIPPTPSQTPPPTMESLINEIAALSFLDKNIDATWLAQQIALDPNFIKKNEYLKSAIEDELSRQSLYKTELCRSFSETGGCRYGHKCQFAHGEHELRAIMRHPKYKTELCKRFATTGSCPYGPRCRFIHPQSLFGAQASPNWATSWASAVNQVQQQIMQQQQQLELEAESSVQYQYQEMANNFVPKVAQETLKAPIQQQEDDKSEVPRRLAIFQNFTKVI